MVSSLFHRKPTFSILIIDDDSFNLTVLKKILQKVNAKVSIDAATNPETAFEKISTQKPNLVLCDFHLLQVISGRIHSSTGIDLWHRVQELPNPPPFLILSGIGEESYLKEVKGLAYPPAFFAKPYQVDSLIQAVEALLLS